MTFTITERGAKRSFIREMSTVALSFRDRVPRPVGAHLNVIVDWPVKYAQLQPIQLHISGFVLRSNPGMTAMTITSHRFRILPSSNEESPAAEIT